MERTWSRVASPEQGPSRGTRSISRLGCEIIIIAPEEMLPRIEREVRGAPVRAFTTLEELDRWRREPVQRLPSIAEDVDRALADAGCKSLRLPQRLQSLLEAIAATPRVPSLHELEGHWESRRSFYRIWRAEIPFTPSAFLRRVRTLHARRLLATGMTRKQAAMLAGYRSVDAMRRNIEGCGNAGGGETP